jgi:hypothetical protein
MGWFDDLNERLGEAVLGGFSALTPDLAEIDRNAQNYSRASWQTLQTSAVGVGGAVFTSIPGLHFAGLVPDVLMLVNRMAVCSYGIGAIAAKEGGFGYVLEREDMSAILARWSGDDSLSDAAIAKMSATGALAYAGQPAGAMFAALAIKHAGIMVGKKFGGKIGGKITAKFMGKYGGKLLGGMVPFAGPAICGGINVWFITQMCTAASEWYAIKLKHGFSDGSVG